MVDLTTFGVGWIIETLAAQEGLYVDASDIEDVAFGMVIAVDKTFSQFVRQHALIYNYQIVDGDPIRLRKRQVNDALTIDFEIDETDDDCIRRAPAPTIAFSRVEPSSLPRQVEVQYIDPDRDFAIATQVARHTAAPTTNTQISVALDFVISAQQARNLAFDILYRLWSQQLSLSFEHKNCTIEQGDTIRLTTRAGVHTCIVTKSTINMPNRTNTIVATILLTSKATGDVAAAGEADPFIRSADDEWAAWMAAA